MLWLNSVLTKRPAHRNARDTQTLFPAIKKDYNWPWRQESGSKRKSERDTQSIGCVEKEKVQTERDRRRVKGVCGGSGCSEVVLAWWRRW